MSPPAATECRRCASRPATALCRHHALQPLRDDLYGRSRRLSLSAALESVEWEHGLQSAALMPMNCERAACKVACTCEQESGRVDKPVANDDWEIVAVRLRKWPVSRPVEPARDGERTTIE